MSLVQACLLPERMDYLWFLIPYISKVNEVAHVSGSHSSSMSRHARYCSTLAPKPQKLIPRGKIKDRACVIALVASCRWNKRWVNQISRRNDLLRVTGWGPGSRSYKPTAFILWQGVLDDSDRGHKVKQNCCPRGQGAGTEEETSPPVSLRAYLCPSKVAH